VERKKGQRYSKEFLRQAVERMNTCGNIAGLARELGLGRRVLYYWRDRIDEANPPLSRTRELMLPSMSRPANPYDNATCESFLKTLKREEIRAVSYHDFEELQCRIEEFIEQYYNRDRLHSALRYRSPDDFEAAVGARPQSAPAALLNFFTQ
jgi:transposase InsO family protein